MKDVLKTLLGMSLIIGFLYIVIFQNWLIWIGIAVMIAIALVGFIAVIGFHLGDAIWKSLANFFRKKETHKEC